MHLLFYLYGELVVTGDLPVGVLAVNVVVERAPVGQDLGDHP